MQIKPTETTFTFTAREVQEIITSHLAETFSKHGNIVQFEWQEDSEECAVIVTVID